MAFWDRLKAAVSIGNANSWSHPYATSKPVQQAPPPQVIAPTRPQVNIQALQAAMAPRSTQPDPRQAIAAHLQNFGQLGANDQVRLLQQATQLGMFPKQQTSALINHILTSQGAAQAAQVSNNSFAAKALNQLNPLDNGKTFQNPLGNGLAQSAGQQASTYARGFVHPFSTLGSAVAHVPQVVYREAQNKPIYDVQKSVFGTTDPNSIRNQILGDTAQTALMVAAPGIARGVGNIADSLLPNAAGRGVANALRLANSATDRGAADLLARTALKTPIASSLPIRLASGAVANQAVNTGFGIGGQIATGQPVNVRAAAKQALPMTALGIGTELAPHVITSAQNLHANEIGSLNPEQARFRKNAKEAYKTISGQKETAPIQPAGEHPPITYTQQVHDYLLSKKNAKDTASRQYIDSLGHIKTLSRPDVIIPHSARDVRYLEQGVQQGALGKVSLKPKPGKNQSYINTAYVIKNPSKIARELSSGVPAPSSQTTAAKNSTFSSPSGADVTSKVPSKGLNVNGTLGAITGMHDVLNRGGTVDEALAHYMKTKKGATFGEAQLALQKSFNALDKGSVNASLNPEYGNIRLGAITPGDHTQPVLNAAAIRTGVAERGKLALSAISALSEKDHALMDNLRSSSVSVLAKRADNPIAFKEAAQKVKAYNDYTHATGSGLLGQNVPYRQNYGAPLYFDLSTPEAIASMDAAKAKLAKTPGYSEQRFFKDYNDANARFGINRKNINFAEDLKTDISRRSNDLSQLALAKGLDEAFPGQLKVGEIGSTPEGTYKQLQIPGGQKLSMPAQIADEINKRASAKPATGALGAYDSGNALLKYIKLGGGTFHALTEVGNFVGQQLTSGKLFTEPGSTAKAVKTFFSDNALRSETSKLVANGTVEKAHLFGLTWTPSEIKADVNITPTGRVAKYTGIKALHDATFGREIPYMKLKTFEQRTQGLDVTNPADVAKGRSIAKAVNAEFGGINRLVEGITPQNAKRWSRILLASDFTESKITTLKNALAKGGEEGTIARQVIAGKVLLLAGLATTGGVIGGELKGKDPQQTTAIVAGKLLDPSFNFGSYKVSLPGTHVSEFTKPFKPFFDSSKDKFSGLKHYATGRLAAVPSEVNQLTNNQDYRGQKIYGGTKKVPISAAKATLNIASGVLPIPGAQGISAATGQQSVPSAIANVVGLKSYQPTAPKTAAPNTSNTQTAQQATSSAFNTPEGQKFLALKDSEKLAAAKTDPKARSMYEEYKTLQRTFGEPKLRPDGLTPESTKILDAYDRRTPAQRKKVFSNDPGAEFKYKTASLESDLLSGAKTQEEVDKSYRNDLVKYELAPGVKSSAFNKYFAEPTNKFKLAQAQYQLDKQAGILSDIQDYQAQKSLAGLQIKGDYSKQVVDLYALSNAGLHAYLQSNNISKDVSKQLVALDQAMYNSNLISYPKYRYGAGVTKTGSKRSYGSTMKRSSHGRSAKIKLSAAPKAPKFPAPKLRFAKGVTVKKLPKAPKAYRSKTRYATLKLAKPKRIKLQSA